MEASERYDWIRGTTAKAVALIREEALAKSDKWENPKEMQVSVLSVTQVLCANFIANTISAVGADPMILMKGHDREHCTPGRSHDVSRRRGCERDAGPKAELRVSVMDWMLSAIALFCVVVTVATKFSPLSAMITGITTGLVILRLISR